MSADRKYSEDLINQSWNDMHSILDKEMPTKKKRRFPFWVFLTGLLLLVLGYFAISDYDVSNENNIASTNEKENHHIIAEANKNQINQHTQEDEKTITSSASTEIQTERLSKSTIQKNSKTYTSSPSKAIKTTSRLSLENNTQLFSNQKEKTFASPSSSSFKVANKTILAPIYKKPSTADTNRFVKLMASISQDIPLLSWEAIPYIPMNNLITIPLKIKNDHPIRHFNFSLAGAGISSFDFNNKGYGFQSRIDYSAKTRFGLEFGVGLFNRSLNNTLSEEELSDIETTAGGIGDDLDNFLEQAISAKNYIALIDKELSLNTSLGIRYTWPSNIIVGIGIKNRRVLNRTFKDGLNEALSSGDEGFLSFQESNVFRDSFYNPYLGVGYTIKDRFYVRLETDLALRHYHLDGPNKLPIKHISFVQAEFGYTF